MAKKDKKYIADMMGAVEVDDYPLHVDVDSKRVPEVKSWDIGETVTVTLTGKVKSLNQGEDKNIRACIEVKKANEDE